MTRLRPSLLMLRWLALGAAAGAALVLAADAFGFTGPWQNVALVLALLALFAISAVVFAVHKREADLVDSEERARRGAEEVSALQLELDRHTTLEQQLRHAKQTAEAAVMAKGEFLATMSHEIRTPLNGIVPMLDLLMHAQLQPDHNEWVRTAYLSSQQMLRIVDDILDYSKLEADKLELETTSFNLRELLEGVLQLMDRPAQTKGLRLSLQIDPAVRLPVRGDPVRLRQVLGNLISNAVKFTERGSVSVHVSRGGETAAQHLLRFEVRDTGIGVNPAAQARLFQAFTQADASTTRLYGGTGLGLAISKRIVDLMGGRIGVESEAGHGATFWFEIPLLKVHGDMPARENSTSGSRLLLLSADPRLRLRLSMLLPNWGLRVSSVETTQEALDRLRTAANQGEPWTYSIVLADLAGMRSTSVALHRNLERHAVYGELRLVGLFGDDPVPDELQRSITLLSRQAPDADLRDVLMAAAVPAGAASGSTPAVAMVAAEPEPEAPQRAARVLLVEDNPVNLMVGQRLLGVLGVNCDTASNGEAALLRMSASRYDVVLMDCQMPVMDGYTATRKWRESEEAAGDGRHLAIVAMTANAMAGDRQKCLDAGMDDYLPKPVTRSELERCLHRWWNLRTPDPVEYGAGDGYSDDVGAVPDRAAGVAYAPGVESISGVESDEAAPAAAALPAATATPAADVAMPAATATATPAADVAVVRVSSAFPAWTASPKVKDMPNQPVAAQTSVGTLPASDVPRPPVVATASQSTAAGASVPPAVARPAQPPVLDMEVVAELRVLLGGEVERLIAVFLDDTPRLILALETAASGPDFAALRMAAHSLKSSSANLGALSLSAAARRVEMGAHDQTLERPAVAVAVIANEFARARHALLATTTNHDPASA